MDQVQSIFEGMSRVELERFRELIVPTLHAIRARITNKQLVSLQPPIEESTKQEVENILNRMEANLDALSSGQKSLNAARLEHKQLARDLELLIWADAMGTAIEHEHTRNSTTP